MTSYFNHFSAKNVLIIAEIGVNHNGSVEKAKQLVIEAKKAGANVVKFQLFKAETLSHQFTPKSNYQKKLDRRESHFLMLKELEFSKEKHLALKKYCDEIDISFATTIYSVEDLNFLTDIKVPFVKLASADLVDVPLLKELCNSEIPLIASTGMATKIEIETSVQILEEKATDFCLLHCTSEYPTPPRHVFLDRMKFIAEVSDNKFGFSDHSIGNTAAVMAVARGARVIEKHFTLNKDDEGPDHQASMDPREFKLYVEAIREAQHIIGTEEFFRTFEEENMLKTSRKSLYLKHNLAKGELVTSDNLYLRRPGNGLNGQFIERVLNKRVSRDLPDNHEIHLGDIQND
jgi:N,N'-diacetyllegionaminate synthase